MRLVFILIIGFTSLLSAQLQPWNPPFTKNGLNIPYAWAGGLNLPQFSEIDLNQDGIKDLIVFDRAAQITLTFLNSGVSGQSSYQYAPEFMDAFPQNNRNFVLAKDFNCDGIEDLFFYNQPPLTSGGIGVMKGYYVNNKIQFSPFKPILKYNSIFGINDIFIFNPDIPGIEDVDGDGDIDIVGFTLDFTFNRNMYYYRNTSAENGFGCDSLQFVLEHQCFGMATETVFNNNTYFLSPWIDTCADNPYWNRSLAEPRHTGSSVTLVDWNQDGNMDVVVGDVSVNTLNLLTSTKNNDTLRFISQDSVFPRYNQSVQLFSYPSSFFLDLNNDGLKDMIAAPTEIALGEAITDSVAWFYENQLSDSMQFNFIKKDFMVGEMIDKGAYAKPAIVDVNGDGLLDIISGHFGLTSGFQTYSSGLSYYQNIGSSTSPAFQWVTDNWANLSSQNLLSMHPSFGDIDGDGDRDMLLGILDGTLILFENTAGPNNPIVFGSQTSNYKGIDVGDNAAPQWVDIDRDGDLDIMIGTAQGRLFYFRNTGTATIANFSSTPTSNTFGFDLISFGSAAASPCFYDKQGSFQLFLGHREGGIVHLNDIDGNITGIYDTVSLKMGNQFFGRFSSLAVADFNQDDTLEFVIGNIRGGLNFYTQSQLLPVISSIENPAKKLGEVVVYPNPSTGNYQLYISESTIEQHWELKIYNALGQQIYSSLLNAQNVQFDITNQPGGFYYVVLNQNQLQRTFKILKE